MAGHGRHHCAVLKSPANAEKTWGTPSLVQTQVPEDAGPACRRRSLEHGSLWP